MNNLPRINLTKNSTKNIVVKRLYHISDIHINLRARHTEYSEVFSNLNKFLKNEKQKYNIPLDKNQDIDCVIVITGDILHSKTELLPECIELTRKFLKNLSKLMPVIMMAGNHDLNINNEERLDGLTPIVNGIDKSFPIHYLKHTGIYKYHNIIWSLSCVRDYHIIRPETINESLFNDAYSSYDNETGNETGNKIYKICLFHGRVNGALLFNKSTLGGEINKKNNKTITPSTFNGYDYTLLGDIHKFQYLNKGKTIAYSGSLIQQNHGETLDDHGILVWDIENGSSQLHEIKNDYGFISYTVPVNYDIKTIESEIEQLSMTNPRNIRLRLLINKLTNSQIEDVKAVFKTHFNLLEFLYIDTETTISDNTTDKIKLDIGNVDYQNKMIITYLLKNNPELSDETIQQIKILNKVLNDSLEENKLHLNTTWKLIRLEFSNLFSYGENNVIKFKHSNGILGIIAENHMGKSSIIDVLLYTLFDKFSRKGNIKDMINNRKNTFKSKITIKIDNHYYIIEKTGTKNAKGKVTTDIDFYRINKQKIKEKLKEDCMSKTKKLIEEYVGTYENIIQTNISVQHNNSTFIEASNIERKKEIEKLLQVDFIETLLKKATGEINSKRAVYKHLLKNCYQENIMKLKETNRTNSEELIKLNELSNKYQEELHKLEGASNVLMENIIPNISQKFEELKRKIGNNPSDELKVLEESISALMEKKASIKFGNGFSDKTTLEELKPLKEYNEEKYRNVKQTAQESIKKIDQTLEGHYSKIKNLHSGSNITNDTINNLIKKKQDKLSKLINQKDDIARRQQEKTQYEGNIQKLEQQVLKLNQQIGEYNQEDLPDKLMELLEETNIIELRDNHELFISKFTSFIQEGQRKGKGSKKQEHLCNVGDVTEFIENSKELFNYEFIEDYQTLNEQNNSQKIELLKTLDVANSELSQEKQKCKKCVNVTKNSDSELHVLVQKMCEVELKIKQFEEDREAIEVNKAYYEEIAKLKEEKAEIVYKMENNREWLDFQNDYNAFMEWLELNTQVKQLQNKILHIKDYIEEYESMKGDLHTNNINLDTLNNKKININKLKNQMSENENRLNVIKASFVSNNTKMEELKKEINIMLALEKEIGLYGFYQNALKALPFMIIKQVIPRLEKQVNQMLMFCTNFMVKFEVEDSKIDVYIDRPIYEGNLILLNNASGFERFISSLAIRMALLDISQLPKPNFIAIDEGWSSFDYQNINNVRLIFDYLSQKFDFVLSISHLSQIKEHCNQQIQLKKDSRGFSIIA
jgi:DNA repair exonuclease SbcCD ATPase subunit